MKYVLRNKLKFSNAVIPTKLLTGGFYPSQVVENPTIYRDPPDGRYLIRGENKHSYKEYAKTDGVWYLLHISNGDKVHYHQIASIYNLYPCLKDYEWEELRKHYTKLAPYWKRAVHGYILWKEYRSLARAAKLKRLKILGKI